MTVVVTSREVSDRAHTSIYLENGDDISITEENSVYISYWQNVEEADLGVTMGFEIMKSNEEKGLVSGWANVSINKDGSLPLDWDDDVIPPDILEKAAIDFMLEYRDSGELHKGNSKGAVVESIVFTKDKQAAIGIPEGTVPVGWFITVKVFDKDVIEKVKDGTYKMFSIQGSAKRLKV